MTPTFTCTTIRRLAAHLGVLADVPPLGHCSVDWKDQSNYGNYRSAYLLANVTRKMYTGNSETSRIAALDAFIATEKANVERNRRISNGDGLNNRSILGLIRAREVIRFIIGNKPTSRVVEHCHFTGGASTSRKRKDSFVQLKYVPTWDNLKCTKSAFPFWELVTEHKFLAYDVASEIGAIRGVTLSEHAQWSSVRKDANIDRSIVIGNDCNVFLQRGCGIFIRDCLKRYGINLQDQSRNRTLARLSSINDDLVTHDAVESSNRILTEAVRLLLPHQWYQYLDALREKTCELPDGSIHKLEMFSSMGNGFTFELQSLIYFALSVAATGLTIGKAVSSGVGVYGDDVVIPQSAYADFLSLSSFLGMGVNTEKTFAAGLFRESCGGHYYFGMDITPFFVREPLDTPEHCIKFVNELHMWYYGDYNVNGDPVIDEIIRSVINRIPKVLRNQVPLDYDSSSGFYSPLYGKKIRRYINKHGCEHIKFQCLKPEVVDVTLRSDCDLPWYLSVLWSGFPLEGKRHLSTVVQRDGTAVRQLSCVNSGSAHGPHSHWLPTRRQ